MSISLTQYAHTNESYCDAVIRGGGNERAGGAVASEVTFWEELELVVVGVASYGTCGADAPALVVCFAEVNCLADMSHWGIGALGEGVGKCRVAACTCVNASCRAERRA